jgi:hypothetical protein
MKIQCVEEFFEKLPQVWQQNMIFINQSIQTYTATTQTILFSLYDKACRVFA